MNRCLPTSRPGLIVISFAVVALPLALGADPPKADAPKVVGDPYAPRRVTLKEADITLDKALDEIQKQADIAIDRTRAETSRSFKLDVNKVPFWEALERVAKASDHRIVFAEAGRKVMLAGGEGATYRELPVSVDGAFRLAVKRVSAVTDLEQERSFCEVGMELHWEPHFVLFLVEPPSANVTAKDNTDRDLQVAEAGRGRLPVSGGGTQLVLRLQDVPRTSRTIKLIEGKIAVLGSGTLQRFEFASPGTKELSEAKEGVTVKVRTDFKEGNELWTAYITVEYPEGGPQLESFESAAWLADLKGYLVSADGKRRVDVNGGEELVNQTERTARVNYRWVPDDTIKLGKPSDWKLVVLAPGKFVESQVKFRLENIPLP